MLDLKMERVQLKRIKTRRRLKRYTKQAITFTITKQPGCHHQAKIAKDTIRKEIDTNAQISIVRED